MILVRFQRPKLARRPRPLSRFHRRIPGITILPQVVLKSEAVWHPYHIVALRFPLVEIIPGRSKGIS